METRTIGGLHLVLFAPSELGLYAKPVAGGFAPVGPAVILQAANADAALNGPMFDVCDGQTLPHGNAEYAASTCDVLEYRHEDGALQTRGSYPSRGLTFSVMPDGSTRIQAGDQVAIGARVSVQMYPPLVQDGRSVAGSSPNVDTVWRSALVVMRDGRMAFAAMVASMPAFATALVAAGAAWAAYTDGGGSSALVTSDGRIGSSEGRPVPSWLVVRKASGAGAWVAAGLVALVAWWAWRRNE